MRGTAVALAEWLRRVPAKYMGFPRESSNLSGDVFLPISIFQFQEQATGDAEFEIPQGLSRSLQISASNSRWVRYYVEHL
jgi:hypothetical protein